MTPVGIRTRNPSKQAATDRRLSVASGITQLYKYSQDYYV
jgi:hypothetical protein